MKNIKLFILLFILIAQAFSADLGVDFKVGAGLEINNSLNGLDITVALPIHFSEKLVFQPELHFYSRGSTKDNPFSEGFWNSEKNKIDSTIIITEYRVTRYYLELPLLLKIRIPKEKISPYFAFGHSFGIGVGISERYKNGDEKVELDFKNFQDEGLTSLSIGLAIEQFGIEIPLRKGYLILEQRYQLGWVDRTYDSNYAVLYSESEYRYTELIHQFSFQVGYGF